MVYELSRIKEIVRSQLIYLDENNQEKYIDLKQCNENWITFFNNNIQDFVTWNGEAVKPQTTKENHCVGERDWFAEKPYFEFYSMPKIRFEIRPQKHFLDFLNKNWHQRYYKYFHEVSKKLGNAGWSTFDLG